jgi:N utilization substance protein A
VIQWDDDIARFIGYALSPARIVAVDTFEEEKRAIAHVEEDQLSLAIGKRGQNVRLAAKLTGWRIDIVKAGEEPVAEESAPAEPTEVEKTPTEEAAE